MGGGERSVTVRLYLDPPVGSDKTMPIVWLSQNRIPIYANCMADAVFSQTGSERITIKLVNTWYSTYRNRDIVIRQYESTVSASQLVQRCHIQRFNSVRRQIGLSSDRERYTLYSNHYFTTPTTSNAKMASRQ